MPELSEYTILPSVISCDLLDLRNEAEKLKESGVKTLHIDMLDGNFSPSFPVGIDTYKQLAENTDLGFDIHIMSNNNELFVSEAIKMKPKRICFQVEGEKHIAKYIQQIKAAGIKAGLAFAPATSVASYVDILPELDYVLLMRIEPGFAFQAGGQIESMQKKIESVRKLLDSVKPGMEITVDGRVAFGELRKLIELGANNLVGGSKSMFVNRNYKENYEKMRKEILGEKKMTEMKTTIINETGIHARPASMFVQAASKFKSKVFVRNVTNNDEYVNAKSIMMVLTQELCKGNEVEIKAEGPDEEEAVKSLIELIDGGFGE